MFKDHRYLYILLGFCVTVVLADPNVLLIRLETDSFLKNFNRLKADH